jgi:hypothetical protein
MFFLENGRDFAPLRVRTQHLHTDVGIYFPLSKEMMHV